MPSVLFYFGVDVDRKDEMIDNIEHCRNRMIQGNKPICGIYAFLNGFYDGKVYNLFKWKKLVKELWRLSIDESIPNNISLLSKNNIKHYSYVGEFFDSKNLERFLKDIINVKNDFDLKDKISKLINRKIMKIDISSINRIDWNNFSDKNGEIFYLVPINSWKNEKDKYNMHWIYLKKDNKIVILNSAGDRSGEKQALKHTMGENKIVGKQKYISNMTDLDKVVINIQDRCPYVRFDFKKWAKYKCYGVIRKRMKTIKESPACEYSFSDSKFQIIKVTYYCESNGKSYSGSNI